MPTRPHVDVSPPDAPVAMLREWESTWIWCLLVLFGVLVSPRADAMTAARDVSVRSDSSAERSSTPIEEVRADTEGNFVPDAIGDTVSIVGRVSTESGVHPAANLVFVQDRTAGIAVMLPKRGSVERGALVQVRGTVEQKYGLTQIDAVSASVLETGGSAPVPLPITVSTAQSDRYEGRLVRLRARVVRSGKNDGGRYLLLADASRSATARLALFIPNDRLEAFHLDRFDPGTEIQVTGPLAQYDAAPPYDDYYQILPRSPEDVESAGILSTYYETAIILIVGGALLAVIVVLTLRTAVKRRTEQLAESRARFRRLAEATFEGIIIHDDGEIVDVNRALTEMTGYDRDDLIGRSFLDVLSHSTRDLVRDTVQPSPDEPYEVVLVRKDGSSFPAEVEEKVVDASERQVRVAAIRNVSERKKWETEILLAKKEAEEMAQLKSSLLNNMSHELRTPITSIIGYAELIINDPEADHRAFAAQVLKSGKRLSRTLRSVLQMAKVEAGTLDVEPQTVNMRTLMDEVVHDHEAMLREKELSLSIDASNQNVLLYTDRTVAYRVFANLVHNAVKFTDSGGVQISLESTDPGVRVEISDTGIGIDPEFRPDLFEPFVQESDGPARSYEGTGLGLALTDRMVELLGGTVEVESEKGRGSTFTVELPPIRPFEEAVPVVMGADAAS